VSREAINITNLREDVDKRIAAAVA